MTEKIMQVFERVFLYIVEKIETVNYKTKSEN